MALGAPDGALILGEHSRRSLGLTPRRPGNAPQRHSGTDPLPPRRPVALRGTQCGMAQPHKYHWILEAWGHTFSKASGGGPCRQATNIALGADLSRMWVLAIPGTVPDGEGLAASIPPLYGIHGLWVHTVDAQVILHLLQHADCKRTRGVPRAQRRRSTRWPCSGFRTACACANDTLSTHSGLPGPHPTTATRSLHKADWAAS